MQVQGVAGAIGKIISLPFQIVGGTAYGTYSASMNGAPAELFKNEIGDAARALAAGQEGAGVSLFKRIANFFDTHVGSGIQQVKGSGFLDDMANFGAGDKKAFADGLGKLLNFDTASGGIGGRGAAVLLAQGAASIGLAVVGFKTAISNYWKMSQSQKGYSPMDYHRNSWLHGLTAVAGLGMGIGGVLGIPGVAAALAVPAAFGLPLALGSLVVYGGLRLVANSVYGLNMFTYPKDYLPWPLYLPFERSARDMRNMRLM